MEKRLFAKFVRLPNVVGRVDYISNPKRQENLLGFYQTPADPAAFWSALAEESQALAQYNKAQMEEHNRIEQEKFAAGEIKKKQLWKTVEARENILCLPNDVYGRMDPQQIAQILAEDIKARHGIECAVGVHMNGTGTNFHAHIIMPERVMLEDSKESIATRNTYFDAAGKRSTKKECVDETGVLKPGCRMVRKGERLHQRRFSEKDPRFAAKGFAYSEKLHFAEMFNQWSCDTWVVYNHYRNPHLRLYNQIKGEPEGLHAWKERENEKIRQYNAAIDKMLDAGELTIEQALQVKHQLYAERAEQKEKRVEAREAWIRWYAAAADRRAAYRERAYQERARIRYADSGRQRSTFEMLAILGLAVAGVDVLRNEDLTLGEDMVARPARQYVNVAGSRIMQYRVDEIYRAAGRKPPSEILAEKKVKKLADTADRKPTLEDIIAGANSIRSERAKNDGRSPPERNGR